ncbi:nitronate monooxygenase [Sphaerobacter sp.]|uniref:NAD(P)H-dependent flavin oxidoreductase n=1 Tax=Sphaerobacter sp. TaxID=2099654 RepID=UPI001D2C5467|nr:nitronate monooxygenase [Sphaerobacter sp.]MBX5444771.1 nitronate monooxygenase [Sphaerobacter sp.]
MRTRVTEIFGIRYPIVQGGLAHLAFAELCAAVSNAGGLGQISAATIPGGPDGLRAEIRKVRKLTDRPFAVNIAISAHRDSMALVEAALAEDVRIMSFTAGNPEPYLRRLEGTGVKTLVLVASVRQAQKVEQLGGTAVIAVGYEGGGHLGRDDVGTMVLVPRILESVSIPVLASGGIGDGRGLAAALAMGADGIEMGTRFVATAECIAHPNYKQALVAARETDTLIIERSLGTPGRVLAGPAAERILALEQAGARDELIRAISGAENRRAAIDGDMEGGWVWAGQVAGLIHDIPSVQDLLDRIVGDAARRLRAAAAACAAN